MFKSNSPMITADYRTVTETGSSPLTREAVEMMYNRYKFAAEYAKGKRVLEVACGAGQGLGLLAGVAKEIVGGDCTQALVEEANAHYQGRVRVRDLDAHALPYGPDSFDVILLFEAIYYLSDPRQFLKECRRVLSPDGLVLIATANRERPDFNPSPFSVRYYSAGELIDLLESEGFGAELFGAFRVSRHGAKGKLIFLIRKLAVALHLIPKTMKGKALLKRLFYGKLQQVQEVTEGMAGEQPVDKLMGNGAVPEYKVLFAVARRR